MSEPTIAQTAPYMVEVEQGKSYLWCACGLSKKQPFCDASHKGSDFKPIRYEASEAETIFFCGCKRTKNGPICDDTHLTL